MILWLRKTAVYTLLLIILIVCRTICLQRFLYIAVNNYKMALVIQHPSSSNCFWQFILDILVNYFGKYLKLYSRNWRHKCTLCGGEELSYVWTQFMCWHVICCRIMTKTHFSWVYWQFFVSISFLKYSQKTFLRFFYQLPVVLLYTHTKNQTEYQPQYSARKTGMAIVKVIRIQT